jgi:hypothetical protein
MNGALKAVGFLFGGAMLIGGVGTGLVVGGALGPASEIKTKNVGGRLVPATPDDIASTKMALYGISGAGFATAFVGVVLIVALAAS